MTVFRWIFLVVVIAAVGLAASNGLKPRPKPPVRVKAVAAVKASITHTVSGAGKLEPIRKVNVSSQITGTLLSLEVGIGSKVVKGQILGQIDASRYATQVSQQRAQLQSANADVRRERANLARLKADADRLDRLVERGAAGTSELEQAHGAVRVAEANLSAAQGRVQMAQAGLQEAEKVIEWATLRAPVDGTVLAVQHRVGERVRGSDFAEDVVLVIGSVAEMDVRVEVGEHDVVHIKPGQQATIEIDAIPDVVVNGSVIDSGRDAIVKNAGTDNEVTTFPVWIELTNPPVAALSGMSAQVRVATETRPDVIAVPIQAVTLRPAEDPKERRSETAVAGKPPAQFKGKMEKVVFVVKDGVVEKRRVMTGLSSDTLVEIVQGLAEGEIVVEGPYRTLARQLEDGMKIEVEPEPEPEG